MSDGGGDRVVLDLFSGLGGFSQAFEEAEGWEVITVDIEERFDPDIQADVFDLRPSDLPDADVILASPPCDYFSRIGNHDQWDFDQKRPVGDGAKDHLTLVYHTIGIVKGISPEYWFLENPLGRLRWFLGEPTGAVSYCQYGAEYMKPTDLWGEHPPMTYKRCNKGDSCHVSNKPQRSGGPGNIELLGSDPSERAKVPYRLSKAILEAVESAYENPPPEQSKIEAYL